MANCRLRQLNEDGSIVTMTCDDVRENHQKMKSSFREKNGTDHVESCGGIDRMFVEYSNTIDNFLSQCECEKDIPLKCNKCPNEDHEGYFCRCEGRNIKLAKQLRKNVVVTQVMN